MRRAAVAAATLDLLHDRDRRAEPEPAAAERLGDQDREEARFGDRVDERLGIGAIAVKRLPVGARKAGTQPPDRIADLGKASLLLPLHRQPRGRKMGRTMPLGAVR